jgi:hypothetical protein
MNRWRKLKQDIKKPSEKVSPIERSSEKKRETVEKETESLRTFRVTNANY